MSLTHVFLSPTRSGVEDDDNDEGQDHDEDYDNDEGQDDDEDDDGETVTVTAEEVTKSY